MGKNEFIKMKEQEDLPLQMQYLTKDTKSSEKVSLSFIEKFNGEGMVGQFYKSTSIICDLQQKFQDVK